MYLNFIKRKLIFIAQRRLNSIATLNDLSRGTNTLIVNFKHELSDTQIYPFYFYRHQLKTQSGIHFQEINLNDLDLKNSVKKNSNIKRIYFQHGFMMPDNELEEHLKYLSEVFPAAKIAFMDWFAPLSIRYATVVDQYADIYIKKQTFKNFDDYNRTTVGDTNLSDYYSRRHHLNLPEMSFSAPAGFEKKIRLWPNFYLSPQMVDLFMGSAPELEKRPIDLHARIAVNGCEWYRAMRKDSADAIKDLNGYAVVSQGRVRRHKFFDELRNSKMVFSPFGYGEVCWRDYEAYATGSLLIKPSMDHLITFSDDFLKCETYIDINWDLTDLNEKIQEVLTNDSLRKEITLRAFNNFCLLLKGDYIPNYIGLTFP